jgi:hypothetical protein
MAVIPRLFRFCCNSWIEQRVHAFGVSFSHKTEHTQNEGMQRLDGVCMVSQAKATADPPAF